MCSFQVCFVLLPLLEAAAQMLSAVVCSKSQTYASSLFYSFFSQLINKVFPKTEAGVCAVYLSNPCCLVFALSVDCNT